MPLEKALSLICSNRFSGVSIVLPGIEYSLSDTLNGFMAYERYFLQKRHI